MSALESRFQQLLRQIRIFEQQYQRPAGSVKLLAVSKSQTIDNLLQIQQAGQHDFGENYLQEALQKIQMLSNLHLCWHFIGQIQSNKTRDIANHFDWVHSVDRLSIAQKLSQHRKAHPSPLNICLQVNIENETGKGGFNPAQLLNAASEIADLPHLQLRGLMIIPRAHKTLEQQRQPFRELRQLRDQLKQKIPAQLDTLSMGMSHDLEAAIAEGASIVRVGTAIFGPRQPATNLLP